MTRVVEIGTAGMKRRVKDAFDCASASSSDAKGYVSRPEGNLIEGGDLARVMEDLDNGAGNELRCMFCAVHSSCAFAVNTFGRFKDRPGGLVLAGAAGFGPPTFEKELSTGLGGTGPTLDVFLRHGDAVWAIESKFLEYFEPKLALFAASYDRIKGQAATGWLTVMEDARRAGPRNLDVAQLVKHYFGLKDLLANGDGQGWIPTMATLLYLFWEPEDADQVAACLRHRQETDRFSSSVGDPKIQFRAMSYRRLWDEWSGIPALAAHVAQLRRRYSARVT